MKKYIFPMLLFATLTAYQNCSDVSFKTAQTVAAQSCTDVLQTTHKNLRIIFMVDDSGSTLETDNNKYYRAQTIQEFLKLYGSKTNLTYAFGSFAANRASFYNIQNGSFSTSTANVFGSSANLSSALSLYLNTSIDANSNTPYKSAFDAIQSAVSTDIPLTNSMSPNAPDYAIVFMSDGMPNPGLSHAGILKLVSDLKSAVMNGGRLATVSTVYFGPEDDANDLTAMQNLVDMAKEGDGQFVDTNKSDDLTIDTVISVPGQVCTGA